MQVTFRPLTAHRHSVTVERTDGTVETVETVELDTKDFLRHDFAHLVVESVLGIADGVWGCVAAGASLSGDGLDAPGVELAERLAGPMQTMMRVEAPPADILAALERVAPDHANPGIAEGLHQGFRSLTGHWRATRQGSDMRVTWPLPIPMSPPVRTEAGDRGDPRAGHPGQRA